MDIVRPICQLLNAEYDGLENFEALMALGNLAVLNESTRARIIKETEFITAIENYMFEEHTMIRRAAVQCWTNLCCSPLMVKRCDAKNDKVKYTVLLCGDDDDPEIVKAASGALAMLTSGNTNICKKVFEVSLFVRNRSYNILKNFEHKRMADNWQKIGNSARGKISLFKVDLEYRKYLL